MYQLLADVILWLCLLACVWGLVAVHVRHRRNLARARLRELAFADEIMEHHVEALRARCAARTQAHEARLKERYQRVR